MTHVYTRRDSQYGPSWHDKQSQESLERINAQRDTYQANTQAVTEAVMLLHSIRRTLVPILVLTVIAVIVGALAMIAAFTGGDPAATNPYG